MDKDTKFSWFPREKKAMELAIPLLVLMTLILTISALIVFNINSRSVSDKIINYNLMDDILIREKQINFYINDIFENAVVGIPKGSDVKAKFIENFKEELKKYKNGEVFYIKELGQLESQLTNDKIKIEDKKISIVFKIETGKEFPDKMTIIYVYEKEFHEFLK